MLRRQFIQLTASQAAFLLVPDFRKDEPIQKWMDMNDQAVRSYLQAQQLDPEKPFFGGIPDEYGIYHPGGAAGLIKTLATSYVSPTSAYYLKEEVQKAMIRGMEFLLSVQHDDGTIDLLSTNFHSTPDTGFVVEPLCLAYTILKKHTSESSATLLQLLRQFLLAAGGALTIGGIHTPNHRWVVSMALSRIHALFPDPKYITRIEAWLAEGIDIDPDGQYTEKSTAIYSPLTNRCLITIARLLNKPELLEPVRRNLEMSLYYLRPNGEIATEGSGRQDQYKVAYPHQYYYPFWYMALKDQNGKFAEACALIERYSFPELSGLIAYYLEDPFLNSTLPLPLSLPANYRQSFPGSSLIRIRREHYDATILANNHTFFTFFSGEAVLQAIQLSTAFFGKGEFKSESLMEKDESVWLQWQLSKGYYQLFPKEKLSGNGNWEEMPRELRPSSEMQHLKATIKITEIEQGFELDFSITGTDHVPVAIELAFRHGGQLEHVTPVPNFQDTFLLSEEVGKYYFKNSQIVFGPGRCDHWWTQLRGGLPKLNAMSVYLTGFTPFEHVLKIQAG